MGLQRTCAALMCAAMLFISGVETSSPPFPPILQCIALSSYGCSARTDCCDQSLRCTAQGQCNTCVVLDTSGCLTQDDCCNKELLCTGGTCV